MQEIRKSFLALSTLVVLSSCLFKEDDPYPPISKAKLAGCWVANAPFEGECEERCYTSGGGDYSISVSGMDKPGQLSAVEGIGKCTLSGNTLSYQTKFGNTGSPNDTATRSGDLTYTIIRDTLYSITKGGRNGYARSDSINNCKPHWRVFPKPADWDLD